MKKLSVHVFAKNVNLASVETHWMESECSVILADHFEQEDKLLNSRVVILWTVSGFGIVVLLIIVNLSLQDHIN